MGVSGFLISCARRWAISCHALMRWRYSMRAREADISSSMRLKVTARSVSSSEPVMGTRTDRSSPLATTSMATARRLMRRVTPRARIADPALASLLVHLPFVDLFVEQGRILCLDPQQRVVASLVGGPLTTTHMLGPEGIERIVWLHDTVASILCFLADRTA